MESEGCDRNGNKNLIVICQVSLQPRASSSTPGFQRERERRLLFDAPLQALFSQAMSLECGMNSFVLPLLQENMGASWVQ